MAENRTTFLIGAGVPLDLKLKDGIVQPNTKNITDRVLEPYENPWGEPIDLVERVYNVLKDSYPKIPKSPWEFGESNINFEHLFHVLEMLNSYIPFWEKGDKKIANFPFFSPFTKPGFDTDYHHLHFVMRHFIMRVMDIVDGYNKDFRQNRSENKWYGDFFRSFETDCDFFNLNYDTTIEDSILEYEDGYEQDGKQSDFLRFNPKRLYENPRGLSTVNHIHGCINYFQQSYEDCNEDAFTYLDHDMYKYKDYADVKRLMIGHGGSEPRTQSGEAYFSSPIITGLRKPEKLNDLPFEIYHSHLTDCIVRSPRLVIIGYGFGDLYCNQLLERMHFIHGDRCRIVIIDKWDIPEREWKWHGHYYINSNEGFFISRAMECNMYKTAVKQLYDNMNIDTGTLYSDNGRVMVFPDGFREAASSTDVIIKFLNS